MTPIGKVRTYEGNPRRGDIEAIKASVRANGLYRAPIARKESDEVLVNNHTVIACRELGATAVPIDWRSIPDDEKARDIVLVDNRTSDLAGYDQKALAAMLVKAEGSPGGLTGTGYDRDAMAKVLDRAGPPPDVPDPLPIDPPAKPRSKPGQVYKLGAHRLLCGDATEARDLSKLMKGETADMLWTDPPYGVDLVGRMHGSPAKFKPTGRPVDPAMDGDDLDDPALEQLLTDAMSVAREHVRPGGAFYLCHGAGGNRGEVVLRAIRKAGWSLRQPLVWVKPVLVLGRQDYQWRHEQIAYGWRPGDGHHWYGGFDKTTVDDAQLAAIADLPREQLVEAVRTLLEAQPGSVVRMARPFRAELHPTVKPSGLVAKHVANSAPGSGIVLDPFAGSGSTLIACERTGRQARLVEIDPAYCDVIRDRYKRIGDEVVDDQEAEDGEEAA